MHSPVAPNSVRSVLLAGRTITRLVARCLHSPRWMVRYAGSALNKRATLLIHALPLPLFTESPVVQGGDVQRGRQRRPYSVSKLASAAVRYTGE